jgi:putative membrane protein
MKNKIILFTKGMAMGAADIVPGVSGGTVAFVTGIYQELLDSINSVNVNALKTLKNEGVGAAWKAINGSFLLTLLSGILLSILSLAKGVHYLLSHHPILLWAFFFGLIIASALYIAKQVTHWNSSGIFALISGALIAFCIGVLTPGELPATPTYFFLAGSIAICAMILPGISGSFILLLLGMYAPVIAAIKGLDLMLLGLFAAGCGVGLLLFSRVLAWLMHHYHNLALSLLTGFMLGSLMKLWPWKQTLSYRISSHGQVPLVQENLLPMKFEMITGQDPHLLAAILLAIGGFMLVWGLDWLSQRFSK